MWAAATVVVAVALAIATDGGCWNWAVGGGASVLLDAAHACCARRVQSAIGEAVVDDARGGGGVAGGATVGKTGVLVHADKHATFVASKALLSAGGGGPLQVGAPLDE